MNVEQSQQIKDAWRRATSGNREVAILPGDLKHEQIQVDPGESQFIDLMRFEVEQACRFWRVPPTMVYAASSGQSVTYANVTQNDLAYLKNSLDGYLVRVEEALTDILPRPQYVKANRNAVLRADVIARHDVLREGDPQPSDDPQRGQGARGSATVERRHRRQLLRPRRPRQSQPQQPAADAAPSTPDKPAKPA
jgi:phage portal protein BeeE